jgi:hypothetical protein
MHVNVCMYVCMYVCKQVISLLVRPNSSAKSLVNLESEERFYMLVFNSITTTLVFCKLYVCMYVFINTNDGIIFRSDKHFCWMDGYAAFRKGELLSGRLGKTIVYIHTYIHTYIRTCASMYLYSCT